MAGIPPSLLSALLAGMPQSTPRKPGSVNIPQAATPPMPSGGANGTAASSPPIASHMCEQCHSRPKYHDGTKTHPYCGKNCAAAARNQTAASGTCIVCHSRPKFFDGTRTHPYCSKSCANKFSTAEGTSPNTAGMCQIPGCNKPAYKGPTGQPGKYCSIAHKRLAETACLWCRSAPKQGDRHFCGTACANDAAKKAVVVLEVPEGHVTFNNVAGQFKTSWRHNTRCPTVKHIYKIVGQQSSIDQYEAYKNAVESRGQFVSAGRSAGNERRRWHGTKRECTLGDNGNTQFCSSATCSLCCIIKTSFDISCFAKKTGWGRFGAGIYTSSTSSKSNDYSQNAGINSSLKAVLLNKVIVGKGYKMTNDNSTLKAPPAGYDSVLGEKGGSLNHDELIVYNNDAIRPSFLVMYEAK
ncbi:Poly [ADP-ribose] polymerase 3 [Grifola frondosa]|uniref:Poly [ADP-ribose] polymerase 3 n=1 Tax=Grifola frondosa TaxID=5627 RepID=A0A1C7LTP3_GRIFR|nr:Poly [ADP-ribose] polymerase 3 [Grifola frondosa]